MENSFFFGFILGSLWSVVLLLLNKRNGKGKPDLEKLEALMDELGSLLKDKKKK